MKIDTIGTAISMGTGVSAGEFVEATTGQPDLGYLANAITALVTIVVTNWVKARYDAKRIDQNLEVLKDYNKKRKTEQKIKKQQKKRYGYGK